MLLLPLFALVASTVSPLTTVAERSGFTRTGRYDEVPALCDAFAAAYPARVRCMTFGTSPEGRDLKALVVSDAPDPKKAPAILVQGGIHAGEIDGKDAGFLFLRELLEGKVAAGVLGKVTLVFVPVFNVDGHERFGKNNRPNQRGPEEMGWRTTAQNLNLNRDYMKADTPEMQAMLRLLNAWDPVVYVDLHVTDGAQFQHDISVQVDPTLQGTGTLQARAKELQQDLMTALTKSGHKPVDFYPQFDKGDPATGFCVGVTPPRFSSAYWALHGHMGILVETHSWKSYAARVKATHDVLVALFTAALSHVDAWAAAQSTDPAVGAAVPVAWDHDDTTVMIDFLGYEYTRTPSPISGALRTRYDEKKPAVWHVPLYTRVKPVLSIDAPFGWVVPPAWAALAKGKLDLHGVQYTVLSSSKSVDGAIFRASAAKLGESSSEGHQVAVVSGAWTKAKIDVDKGALFVPYHQKLGVLALQLLEPTAPDSLVRWGFMNGVFEQKEYMEDYVAESVAEAMLKDPQVAAEFAKKLDEDPAFAKDPGKRLDFFYQRHPSYDARFNVVPIVRVDAAP